MELKKISLEQLKQHNGLNGRKAYIACLGLVYDVTDSFLWKGGRHQACYSAGNDLTGSLEHAPHGIEFLQKFPIVGRID